MPAPLPASWSVWRPLLRARTLAAGRGLFLPLEHRPDHQGGHYSGLDGSSNRCNTTDDTLSEYQRCAPND